jgi:hypothetical protein
MTNVLKLSFEFSESMEFAILLYVPLELVEATIHLTTVNLLYNHTLGDHFFFFFFFFVVVTLMNCDLNVYSHIPYKPLQDCDYRGKENFTKQPFYVRIKVSIA